MTGYGTSVQLSDDWSEGGWFSFPRAFIRDKGLSWKAKGIAALLASHSSSFKFSATELERWAKDGRDGTAAGLKELETAGYLVRERQSSGQMVYRLFPEPRTENPEEAGRGIHPEEADPAIPHPEIPGVYKESSPKDNQGEEDQDPDISVDELDLGLSVRASVGGASEKDASPRRVFPAEMFDHFWDVVPKKTGKQGARTSWERAVRKLAKEHGGDFKEAARVVWKGMARYQRERAGQPATYTKNPETWLNKGCWDDEHASAPSPPSNGFKPYKDKDYWPEPVSEPEPSGGRA